MPEYQMCIKCGEAPARPRKPGSHGPSPRTCEKCGGDRSAQKRWEERNPQYRSGKKHVARGLVSSAITRGELVPAPCAVCHKHTDEVMLEAHHHDYDQPLNVTWLCKQHHSWVERLLGNRVIGKRNMWDYIWVWPHHGNGGTVTP